MECLYWLKMSFDGKRSLLFRARDDLRTVTHSSLLPLFRVELRDYSPIVPLGVALMPAKIYRWNDDC